MVAPRRNPTRRFTLIELMIVIGIIMILAGLAIPNTLEAEASANEASAAGTLKSIQAAQKKMCLDRSGQPAGLGSLVEKKYLSTDLADNQHSGYGFAVRKGKGQNWDCAGAVAWPLQAGMSGTHVYLVTPDGRILRFKREWKNSASARSFVLNHPYFNDFNEETLSKWSQLDG